jgi:hypothetical protein
VYVWFIEDKMNASINLVRVEEKYPEVKEKVPPKRPIEEIAQEAGIPQHLVRYAPNLRIAHPYKTRQTKLIEETGLGTTRAAYYPVSYPSSSSSSEPTGKKGKKIPLKPPSTSSSSSTEGSLFSPAVRQPDGTHLSTLDAKLKQQQEYRDFNLERFFSGMEPNPDAVEEDEIDVELNQNEPEDLSMPRDADENVPAVNANEVEGENAEAQAGPSTGRVYDKAKFDAEGKKVYECRVCGKLKFHLFCIIHFSLALRILIMIIAIYSITGRKFDNHKRRNECMGTHDRIPCPKCTQTFTRMSSLKVHTNRVH